MKKLHAEIDQRHLVFTRKNVEFIKRISQQLYEEIFNIQVRPKVYENLPDLFADLTVLQSEFGNQLTEIGIAQHPLAISELNRLSYDTV